MKKSILIILVAMALATLAGLGMWRFVTSDEPKPAYASGNAPVVAVADKTANAPQVTASFHTNTSEAKKTTPAVPPIKAASVMPPLPVLVAGNGKTNTPAKKVESSSMAGMAAMLKNPAIIAVQNRSDYVW